MLGNGHWNSPEPMNRWQTSSVGGKKATNAGRPPEVWVAASAQGQSAALAVAAAARHKDLQALLPFLSAARGSDRLIYIRKSMIFISIEAFLPYQKTICTSATAIARLRDASFIGTTRDSLTGDASPVPHASQRIHHSEAECR